MKLTFDLINCLERLSNLLDKGSIDEFTEEAKKVSSDYDLDYKTIYYLISNYDFLHNQVLKETTAIDKEIIKLKNKIEVLESYKKEYGSVICRLFGHNYENDDQEGFSNDYTCTNCGKSKYLNGQEKNKILAKEKCKNSRIYPVKGQK